MKLGWQSVFVEHVVRQPDVPQAYPLGQLPPLAVLQLPWLSQVPSQLAPQMAPER
jgi:hypothetical protein